MLSWLKIFFGFAPEPHEAEGFFSPAHLIFVSVMLLITVFAALAAARKRREAVRETKLRPLKFAAGGTGPLYTLLVALVYFAYLALLELGYALIVSGKRLKANGEG